MPTIPNEGDISGDYTWTCTTYTDGSTHTDYATVERVSSAGGANSLFGTDFTDQDVNSPEFGVLYSVNPDNATTIRANAVRLKVYFALEVDKGTVPSVLPESLAAVSLSGPLAVAVGAGGLIFTSADRGETWTQRTSGVTENLYCVIYARGKYIVGGQNGVLLTSTDGISWTRNASSTFQDIFGLAFSRNKLLATGTNGDALSGTDVSDLVGKAVVVDPYTPPA